MNTTQTLLQNNYTHKTARGVSAILLTPSTLATFDDSIATHSTSMMIPWPFSITPGLPVNYCIPGIQYDNSIDTKYSNFANAFGWFYRYPLTIMRVSCESSDFWKSFHCFHPSVCRICTIGDICFPPFYKATKHLQQLRSKGEDIALLLHSQQLHSPQVA